MRCSIDQVVHDLELPVLAADAHAESVVAPCVVTAYP